MTFKKKIYTHYVNSFAWKSDKKIVVFESDDWGSVRTPNKNVYDELLKSGISVDNCSYSKYDGFETADDYNALFEVLRSVVDGRGRHPVFTLNFNTANPDFKKIKESNFNEYFFERFDITYERYGRSLQPLRNGISEGLIFPQYHGREHVNIFMWLDMLKTNEHVRIAFKNECYALGYANSKSIALPYLAAYAPYKNVATRSYFDILKSGSDLFNQVFEFHPTTFIAPIYLYEPILEEYAQEIGITAIQGLPLHTDPVKKKRLHRYFHTSNDNGQIQLVRNCTFEPSYGPVVDWISECMQEIGNAFFHNKPAIICTHRLNYMGSLEAANRDENLELLASLLQRIVQKWDVEFLTSSELASQISNR